MLHVFLDTEFTQFRDGQLLSIGLVCDDGARHAAPATSARM
jgi:hypothetical protein